MIYARLNPDLCDSPLTPCFSIYKAQFHVYIFFVDTRLPVSLIREDVRKDAFLSSQDDLTPPAQQTVTAKGIEIDLLGQGN